MTLDMQENTITIRQLVRADAAALRNIRVESARLHPEAFHSSSEENDAPLSTLVERIAHNQAFGAFDGRVLIGTAMLAQNARSSIKTRHVAEVWSVYVRSEYRRLGLARQLLQRVIASAIDGGFEGLALSVAARNSHVRRFYESLGFVRYGCEPMTVKLPDGSYVDHDLMMLDLRRA